MPKVSLAIKVNVTRERLADFLQAMKIDAEGTRAEEGNLRFDVVALPDDGDGPVVSFLFYESYVDQAAMDFHCSTEHFKAWIKFCESGGVASKEFIGKGEPLFY